MMELIFYGDLFTDKFCPTTPKGKLFLKHFIIIFWWFCFSNIFRALHESIYTIMQLSPVRYCLKNNRRAPNILSCCLQMAENYCWDNRIKFLVRYMYDLDGNGYLNKNDFDCLAVKFTVMEGRGEWSDKRWRFTSHLFFMQCKISDNKLFSFSRYSMIMSDLWDQIAEIADLNKASKICKF